MDAREAQLWLQTKLSESSLIEAEKKLLDIKFEFAPISELQWRKLEGLENVRFGMNRDAYHFVHGMLNRGKNILISRNQSDYIETLWHRYRSQHEYKLPEPHTEIMRFIQGLPTETYACDPENDKFTITFQDGDLW